MVKKKKSRSKSKITKTPSSAKVPSKENVEGEGYKKLAARPNVPARSKDNNLVGVSMPRPNAILMKIFGVIGSYKFEQDMNNYGKSHLKAYLQERWTKDKIISHLVARLRKDAKLDYDAGETNTPQIPESTTDNDLQDAIVAYVSYKLSKGKLHVNSPIHLLNGWVVNQGYISKKFSTHIFPDAARSVYEWRYGENYIKNYTLANAEREGQKNYIQSTSAGDLTTCFNNFIPLVNERRGHEVKTFKVIETMIRDESKNLLFISDDPREIKAAHEAGFMVVLVQRPGEPKGKPDELSAMGKNIPVISSLDQLVFINDPNRPPPCC